MFVFSVNKSVSSITMHIYSFNLVIKTYITYSFTKNDLLCLSLSNISHRPGGVVPALQRHLPQIFELLSWDLTSRSANENQSHSQRDPLFFANNLFQTFNPIHCHWFSNFCPVLTIKFVLFISLLLQCCDRCQAGTTTDIRDIQHKNLEV